MGNNSQYLQMFFDESSEYIQILNENILILEKEPENREIIDAVFRAAHSLKGMAATMGFDKLTDLTHKIENILDRVRNEELQINEEIIDFLFAGFDLIKELVNDIKKEGEEVTDINDYLEELSGHINNIPDSDTDTETNENNSSINISLTKKEKEKILDQKKETDCIFKIKVNLAEDSMLKNVRGYMVIKKARELGYLAKSVPAPEIIEDEDFDLEIYLIIVSNLDKKQIVEEIEEIIDVEKVTSEEIKLDSKTEKKETGEKPNNTSLTDFEVSPTVRVDINKLDNLMNMVGELLINKTRLEGLDVESEIYHDIIQQLDRVTGELHHVVMQIRMVPIEGIFNRFPRMVRDLSKELNKEIELTIEGADTELDRSIIDELADPLVHIIRNAIDHGIESPAERKNKGKDPTGNLLLKAYQKGSEIIIEVEDDGKGLDPEKISRTAIEKGITTLEDIEAMEKREILNLIFNPGFSTSNKVTDVSGRGVGMDVVKRVVESLDGQVYIDSEIDEGTRFTISLPLTLAITQALMVIINDEIFAIPLNTISETLTVDPENIRQVRGQDVIVLRDSTIPIVEASQQLNLDVEYEKYKEKDEIPVVIVKTGERLIGLIVDQLLNQQEIVIKSLGKYLVNVDHISGATIVGDGDVALILDVRNIA